jgi:hypothetical protein
MRAWTPHDDEDAPTEQSQSLKLSGPEKNLIRSFRAAQERLLLFIVLNRGPKEDGARKARAICCAQADDSVVEQGSCRLPCLW